MNAEEWCNRKNLRRQLIANVRLHQIRSYGCVVFVTGEAAAESRFWATFQPVRLAVTMDDLYDEDFEDATVSPVPSHVIPEAAVSAKNSTDIIQNSDCVEGDVYSTAPSILIEPVGPEATQVGDLYDDDFCSPGPSAILNNGSVTSADENLVASNLTEILPKGPSTDHSLLLVPPEGSQENNADESIYYEDDFALSTDNVAEGAGILPTTLDLGNEPEYLEQQNHSQRENNHSGTGNYASENHDVFIARDEGAVPAATVLQRDAPASAAQDITAVQHHTDDHDSRLDHEEDINNIELNTDDFDVSTSEKATVLTEEADVAPPPHKDDVASVDSVQPEAEPIIVVESVALETEPVGSDEPTQSSAKESIVSVETGGESVAMDAEAEVTHTISSLNLCADDAMATGLTDTSTSVHVPNEDKGTEIVPSASQKTPTVSPRESSPVQGLSLAEELPVERNVQEEEVSKVVAEEDVIDAGPTLTIDTLPVAISPDAVLNPIASFVAAAVLQAQTNLSRPQSAAARDNSVGAFTPTKSFSRPASASPQKIAEALVERAVSQAQMNLSRPQSAVTRDAPVNPFTPTKVSSRPASASPQKMAEAFVGRTVSQAQINVVMGSPSRTSEGPVESCKEEPPAEDAVVLSESEPTPVAEAEEDKTEAAEPASLLVRSESFENNSEPLKIGEDAMNDPHGSSSLVLDGIPDAHNKSTKSVAYDEFLSTLGLATPSADSKKAAQLRAMVEESREPATAVPATAPPTKKLTKKEQQEADRTFLTSLQYHPPPQQTKKIVYSNSATNVRSASSRPPSVQQPVTKRDLLRGRSAGPHRPTSPARAAPPPKASVPKRNALSPNRIKPPVDHRTQFVAPPLCLPSQMMPKDLVNYLFASGKESELKISLFCQHGRHFATCKADLCVDAHEKYRWLNLVHQKAKEACELVSDADFLWREKLEKALVKEVAEKKEELEEEVMWIFLFHFTPHSVNLAHLYVVFRDDIYF